MVYKMSVQALSKRNIPILSHSLYSTRTKDHWAERPDDKEPLGHSLSRRIASELDLEQLALTGATSEFAITRQRAENRPRAGKTVGPPRTKTDPAGEEALRSKRDHQDSEYFVILSAPGTWRLSALYA